MDNPIPKLNLEWYKGQDLYSEGDVEDLITKLIQENEPENYSDAIFDNFCWSTYYHLTHLRQNILNWYPFRQDADVLEIGCGLGAITGLLCDRCKNVISVELSKRRATAAQWRCREKNNLEIIVGNLNDIEFTKKFDYITLIGVLEYQGNYTNTDNPYRDFLEKIKTLLKPDGTLLIAIENQFGLKYWCGAREDHTSIPFDGINNYKLKNTKSRTFSKAALDELIKKSGFKNTFFYYPMPDYKLPTVIYSQRNLPRDENMQNMLCYYAPDKNTLVAREDVLYQDIIQNQVFEFFANSFLVECTDSSSYGEVEFACLSSERMSEYRIGTRIIGKERVEKFLLKGQAGNRHLHQIINNQNKLKERGLKVCEYRMINEKLVIDYIEAQLCQDLILKSYQQKDFDRIYEIWDLLYEEILISSEKTAWEENIMYTLPLGIEPDQEKYGLILKTAYLDMILRNAFWIDGQMYWFDQEWILENVPAKYVMFNAIIEFYGSFPELEEVLPIEEIALRYEITAIWDELRQFKTLFQNTVMDQKQWQESSYFRGCGSEICVNNINKILG